MATVTIAGSYNKHVLRIVDAAERFRAQGVEVLRPRKDAVVEEDGVHDFVRLEGDPEDGAQVHQAQFDAIDRSDLLYVVNPGGYVGSSAAANVAWAKRGGKLVVLAEPAYEQAVAILADAVGDEAEALRLLAQEGGQ